jgi:hypothetical protein
MNDIDFDEIDKAVNSVGSDKPNTNANETPEPVTENTQTTSGLAGRRSSGQFMDVVHPSSNMRRAPIKMPERPLNQNTEPNKPSVEQTVPNTDVQASQTQETTSESELPTPTIPNSGWAEQKNENEDEDIDKISDDITNELDHKSDELPDTPFIAGTKVEKRPLGAFSTEPLDGEVSTDINSELDDKKDESLPDELQDKLLSIESNESKPGPEAPKETIEPDEKPEVVEKVEVPKAESKPAIATSITQQYEEKPSTGDRDSGPIYDTNSYHKPLISPVKKKSSWSIILWIIAILVLGVGAGVLAYKFIVPIL